MRVSTYQAIGLWVLMAVFPNVVSGQRRRRASAEQHRMDLEDVAFWRALVMEGSTSISSINPTAGPTSVTVPPSTPSTEFPTKSPTKSPFAPSPTFEPTVSFEPSMSDFPTPSPTESPTVSEEPTLSYEPSASGEPTEISNDE